MVWSGKKIVRLQLRTTEAMADKVRDLAELEHRSIQDQLRYLIAEGLKHCEAQALKQKQEQSRQLLSARIVSSKDEVA